MRSAASSSRIAREPIRRDPSLYRLSPDASDGQWDLLRVSREFDFSPGNLTEELIERVNGWAAREEALSGLRLRKEGWRRLPAEILLLDGSPSRMPLAAETERVAAAWLAARGAEVTTHVVSRREALLARAARSPRDTLVLSQAAQRSLYDNHLAEALIERGVVVVPGPLTAPGGPLSNKKTTYELLNGGAGPGANGHSGPLAARYQTIEVDGDGPAAVARAILEQAWRLSGEWNTQTLFVKPQEGGGGRGAFRIDVFPEGFSLPDLSRLGVPPERTCPVPLPLDPGDRAHLKALAFVANRFAASPATARAYLDRSALPSLRRGGARTAYLGNLLRRCPPILIEGLRGAAEPFGKAQRRLARAIGNYEDLFEVRYQPLLCEWIDFGLFSLRVHLRMSRSGPLLESLYARLFPVEFTDRTIGVIGVDSISNRAGMGMEFNRYAPLHPALVAAVGGVDALAQRIRGAFYAFARFVSLLPAEERKILPVRAEFDISPLNGLIAEGNADPVRAQCPNTRWERFRANAEEWLEDAIAYYSWKTGGS
ncbi:MAG: hypothetical protein HYZ11_11315 [Candidatus Tectomicrobia bacterium]|uniref:Uncharacterized protein n=1 Tax=Tectimicrobiota bacterium TaxID=2528274 RepID=A0A932MME0_UNCTE|nr:hypothetical protein [Candidatus Tectomicrobia bacterium]